MDFTFTEEQNILKQTVRNFLEKECPSSFVLEMEEDEQGFTPELWQSMADLGWMGIIVPDEYDGIGGSFLDLVIMLEEMGSACLPGPFFATMLGAWALIEGGNENQKKEFLPKIATGDLKLTLAHNEPTTTIYNPYLINVNAVSQKDGFIVNGTKLFVPDAHVADYIICVARTSGDPGSRQGISLFIVDAKSPGIEITPLKTIAGDKQCEVLFNNVQLPGDTLLGKLDMGSEILDKVLAKAAVARCAEMVGGGRKVLDMSTAYSKEREQFGKPIGSFQAIQHHCANMLVHVDGSRHITYKAAWKLTEGLPCVIEVASAKAWVSNAFKKIVTLGHQVQAATAYMIEHDMPLYSRRSRVWEFSFGDITYHREMMLREIDL